MIQLYIITSTYLTKLFLKRMLENKSGWILNVSSGMAFMAVPMLSVYSASKAYMLHFSEALANELQGTGVSVTCLCPPQTETAIFRRAGIENTKLARAKKMDAAAVAKAGYLALKSRRVIVNPDLKSKLLPKLIWILPRNAVTKMVRAMV
jgi:uncharacterized protein